MPGLPPQTLRIAAQTLDYLESNSQPIVHPNDEFLATFIKEETSQLAIDPIVETQIEEDQIEDLKEVIEIEDETEEAHEEIPAPQLYHRILSDKEKRKMEKVQAKAEKDDEEKRKRNAIQPLKA